MTRDLVLLAVVFTLISLCSACSAQETAAESEDPADQLPPGFMQVIARGRIASIDEPRFVTPDEANIPGDAWVFGVDLEGQPRAYSLKLLNHHEIVNDEVNGRRFAAVW